MKCTLQITSIHMGCLTTPKLIIFKVQIPQTGRIHSRGLIHLTNLLCCLPSEGTCLSNIIKLLAPLQKRFRHGWEFLFPEIKNMLSSNTKTPKQQLNYSGESQEKQIHSNHLLFPRHAASTVKKKRFDACAVVLL